MAGEDVMAATEATAVAMAVATMVTEDIMAVAGDVDGTEDAKID